MTLEEIQKLIKENHLDKAEQELNMILKESPTDKAYLLMGNIFRKKEDWQHALNNYYQAIDINPDSPAQIAIECIQKILNFGNKDLINP